jgi:hypothetical protein
VDPAGVRLVRLGRPPGRCGRRRLLDLPAVGEDCSVMGTHLDRELDEMARRGAPLLPGEPVPGCDCYQCVGVIAVRHAPDPGAVVCPRCRGVRELAVDGDRIRYACPDCQTVSAAAWPVNAAGGLNGLPRIRQRVPAHTARTAGALPPLDVDRARRASIVQVAQQLGIALVRTSRGGDAWARCPFHDDRTPSLHLNARRNLAFCNPCSGRWDPIALVMELGRVDFAHAVRELAA